VLEYELEYLVSTDDEKAFLLHDCISYKKQHMYITNESRYHP
jgi:hypothetical protein